MLISKLSACDWKNRSCQGLARSMLPNHLARVDLAQQKSSPATYLCLLRSAARVFMPAMQQQPMEDSLHSNSIGNTTLGSAWTMYDCSCGMLVLV
jgi:hypothetical protein